MNLKKFFILLVLTLVGFFQATGQLQDSISGSLEDQYRTESNFEFKDYFIRNFTVSSSQSETAEASWSLPTKAIQNTDFLIIRYRQKLLDNDPWKYTDLIPSDSANFKIGNLPGDVEYSFQIGTSLDGILSGKDDYSNSQKMVWSSKVNVSVKRPYDYYSILVLIGALGFFIYGMKVMSDGIQKIAGNKMRQILGAMTSNRFKGVTTGFLTTSVVQSSSATTVMVVSFVNAGLLSLAQAISVIMGANIGTTITGWLVSYFGFKVQISDLALPLIAIAFPLMFSKKNRTKSIAEFMIGFALLFIGLDYLKNSMPDIKSNPELFSFLTSYSGTGIGNVLFAVLMGTIITVLIQSSSAAMTLTLVLCNQGYISFEMAAGLILGENIGTTITANLAAMIGNVHAKRAALAHTIFNVFGVIWMVIAFPVVLDWIDSYFVNSGQPSPFDSPETRQYALAMFHTGFNITNTFLLIWFANYIAKMVTKLIPSKGQDEFHLEYIHSGIINTPELAIVEAKKEVAKYGKLTFKMSGMVQQLLTEIDKKEFDKTLQRIQKYEEITDRLEIEIANYLAKVSENEISNEASSRVRAMLSIANDLERIGDVFFQMSKIIERKNEEKTWFTPEQRNKLMEMFKLVDKSFRTALKNLEDEFEQINLDKAKEAESQINAYRNQLKQEHLLSIESGEYSIKSGQIYTDLFSSCEKVGDHLMNISEAVSGKI